MRRLDSRWARLRTKMRHGAIAAALGVSLLPGCGTFSSNFTARPPLTDVCERRPGICEDSEALDMIGELRRSSVLIRTSKAQGSGIILSSGKEGSVILTNRHVVDPDFSLQFPTSIEVNNDDVSVPANRILVAPENVDLAIIFTKERLGPSIKTASRDPRIGSTIFVVGSPLGSEDSVSAGIISNLRKISTDGGFRFQAIQTDAAINPGNSGGGIFDARTGELLGIITFKLRLSPFETAEGMAYAVPVSLLKTFPREKWQPMPRAS